MTKTGIVILAAGASTRLGQAKQSLLYQGQTLLQRTLDVALSLGDARVVVVLGANAATIHPQLKTAEAEVIINPDWPEGMASSIRTGLSALVHLAPETSSALFLLCDQPFVTTSLLQQMTTALEKTEKGIVACSYQNTLGAPVLFSQKFFPQLMQLKGQEGAKKLLHKHPEQIETIAFPQGAIDIDTPSDYAALQRQKTNS
ncbi:nucleotidyltransferase family protein [Rufibacter immobilis]|uniref:Nucleotidyltransferase family protein n=1 Tax=Rufibacter immobilis TaxID=1348778 RepID=A0A3M9MRG2_9BACT|nr:nucleotidyltransferase family protein [Rufibacter immobilis]RNI27797.1 nucleotidyltransferase family protein [Rufibacter immobilis]